MFRLTFIAIGVFALSLNSAFAQKVVVKKKTAPQAGPDQYIEYDEWMVSFSRNNSPSVFELDSFHKTEEAARRRADKLIQWSNSMEGTAWKLAVIEIEGEASVRGKNAAKKDAEVDLPNLKLKPNRKLGDVLREYMSVLKTSYENAKRAKDQALARTDSLTRKQFDNVNKLVNDYNRQRDDVRAETGYYFAQFQRLTPISPGDLKRPLISEPEEQEVPPARVAPRPDPNTRLVGSWEGTYVQTGDADIPTTAVFNGDGTVTTNGGQGRGRWTLDGDSLRITWSTGAVVTWRVSDNEITGSGRTPRGRSWSVTLRRQ